MNNISTNKLTKILKKSPMEKTNGDKPIMQWIEHKNFKKLIIKIVSQTLKSFPKENNSIFSFSSNNNIYKEIIKGIEVKVKIPI